MAEQTIAAVKLCSLTGLTDRRHRQIADQGFFPPPTRGLYQLTPTIAGMFRYYREAYQRASKTLAEDKQIKTKREIELLDLKIEQQNRRLAPIDMVEAIWGGLATALRQAILASEIPDNAKKDLTERIRDIDPEEYFEGVAPETGEEDPPAD